MPYRKEGKGRFKALALGRVTDWSAAFKNDNGQLCHYTITLTRDYLIGVRVSDPAPVKGRAGADVEGRVAKPHRDLRLLEGASPFKNFREGYSAPTSNAGVALVVFTVHDPL